MIITISAIVVAISNAIAGYSLWRFSKLAIPELREIRRSTDVVRYHILRSVREKRKAEILEQQKSNPT